MDTFLDALSNQLDRIEKDGRETRIQATKTNGRVNRLERNLLIIGVTMGTMLIMSGSRFVELAKTFI